MIFCTTDGSPRSMHALSHAALLARTLGQRLNLVQVFDPSPVTTSHSPNEAQRLEQEMAALAASMRLQLTEVDVQPETECYALLKGESVPDAILHEAANLNASLIAMDTRGHHAIRHALLGSVAMAVLSRASVPVMMTGAEILPPRKDGTYTILATYDGSPASELAFESLRRLNADQKLSIAIASVYVPTLGDRAEAVEIEECQAKLEALRSRYLPRSDCRLIVRTPREFTTPEMIILELADEIRATAIAMSTRGHSMSRHVLLGSFASTILGHSRLPVVLTRA